MPKLLTTEERQQLIRNLDRTDSAPAEIDDESLMLAHQLSLIHGRVRVAVEESGLCFCVAAHFNQHVACDDGDKLAADGVLALFCRVGRQNTPLGVITMIALPM
jgi:hypothetical protein